MIHVSRITATRDLNVLEGKNILKRIGTGKRDLKYVLK
jgi:DeoR/GlpR family transcriptional regulator of sugar metabolism